MFIIRHFPHLLQVFIRRKKQRISKNFVRLGYLLVKHRYPGPSTAVPIGERALHTPPLPGKESPKGEKAAPGSSPGSQFLPSYLLGFLLVLAINPLLARGRSSLRGNALRRGAPGGAGNAEIVFSGTGPPPRSVHRGGTGSNGPCRGRSPRPSSSMSILAPDSAQIFWMTLPPLPMTSRILSGSIFMVIILGAYLLSSGGARRCRAA